MSCSAKQIRCCSTRLVLAVLLLASAAQISAASQTGPAAPASQSSAAAQTPQPLLQYTLPPDKLAKAHAIYNIDFVLFLLSNLWVFVVLLLMLRTGFGPHLRDLAQAASRWRLVQAAVVTCLFALVMQVAQLPFDMYGHHIGLQYGLSVQHWGSWFADWAKGLGLAFIFVTFVGWIFYGVLRRSPRRWWFYFWLALIPILIFVMFVEPVWIEPLFNKYEPLEAHHPELVAQIERVVHRAGMDIPPDRMYLMKASEKTTELNAYVTGFGATKRVVVWDTTIRDMTIPETLFVFGHEMGHYVLGHIPKEVTIDLGILLVLFYIGYLLAKWAVVRYGRGWGFVELTDWASLPLLVLIISLLGFFAMPALNAVSRHYEHQADQYGLEVTHGLVPNSGVNAAKAFQILGEISLDYPHVGPFAEFWLWNHPPIRDRVIYAQTYHPWDEGKAPEFVKSAP